MRHGVHATLLILCGLLPRAASAFPMDHHFAPAFTSDTPGDIISVDGAGVPEPTALSLLSGTLLLVWAVSRRRAPRRNIPIE